FLRDAEGELTEVDFRPVNFASQDVSSLKWGFDYSRPIGPRSAPPPRNQVFQQLRRAGAGAGAAVGRRPGGARPPGGPPPGADGGPSPTPGAADGPGLPPADGPPPGGPRVFAGRGPAGGGF